MTLETLSLTVVNVRFPREILVGNDSKKLGFMDASNGCVTNPNIDC